MEVVSGRECLPCPRSPGCQRRAVNKWRQFSPLTCPPSVTVTGRRVAARESLSAKNGKHANRLLAEDSHIHTHTYTNAHARTANKVP